MKERRGSGLLLDFGGVIHRSLFELMPDFAAREGLPQAAVDVRGPFGTAADAAWTQVQEGEISEREYWASRAHEIGALLGESWQTTDLVRRISALPPEQLMRPEAASLLAEARADGMPTVILTNDLAAFHGPEWVAGLDVLSTVDAVVDGSVNGILKPDPAAYGLAVEKLGVPRDRTVFLDDLPTNVEGARAVGLIALHVDIADPGPAFDRARACLGLPGRTT